jgi:hypothetical protein
MVSTYPWVKGKNGCAHTVSIESDGANGMHLSLALAFTYPSGTSKSSKSLKQFWKEYFIDFSEQSRFPNNLVFCV